MPEVNLESRTAAKGLARLFFIAIVIGLVTGTATWLFIARRRLWDRVLVGGAPQLLVGVPSWAVSVESLRS